MAFDLLLRNGMIVDGTGVTPAFQADVGVRRDRIEAIGNLEAATAAREIDATGLVVSPGFIDPHIHSEIALLGGPHRYGALLQGVTTHLTAPDGFGWAQLPPDLAAEMWQYTLFSHGEADVALHWPTPEAFLEMFSGNIPANVVPQAPHGSIRLAVTGWEGRPATDEEIGQMADLTREWMDAGATGLCAGLDYQPGAFSDERELVTLCQVVAEYDGVYAAHLRYNVLGREEAWREMMRIGRQSGVKVHVSHETVSELTATLLDEAESICDLTFESYMYPAGCTHLTLTLPMWAQEGGLHGLQRRLNDLEIRRRIRDAMHAKLTGLDARKLVFAVTQTGRFIGETFQQVAERLELPAGDLAVKLLEEESPFALMVFHRTLDEPVETQVRRTIRHPRMMVGSDGIYFGPHGHPRGYGCYARTLRLAVRELQAVTLEEAVFKMSGFPAERFQLKDRGTLQVGKAADIVLFDADTVADRSTWDDPWRPPVGIHAVFVNGQAVVEDGKPTHALPGRVLSAHR